jgi:phenylpropionate dioxygenase-like ring-hydroxylating dioxygenase large terminal subunit
MTSTAGVEKASLDQWYAIDAACEVTSRLKPNRLLGCDLEERRNDSGTIFVTRKGDRTPLPSRELYGHVWTTLGAPSNEPVDIPEVGESDRQYVACGPIVVHASGLRVVENFLDMAHFPFVHNDILGAEPHTEVKPYKVEIRRQIDEVWATQCEFYQPQAAMTAAGGIMTQYMYRVTSPFVTLLYKTCPIAPNRWDVICLFVQPIEPSKSRVHPVMFLIDQTTPRADLVRFQQLIFLQDRIILENQRPVLLPLDPRQELPTRADIMSVAYRRWLKDKGVTYGTVERAT